jgi:hypothetical protein
MVKRITPIGVLVFLLLDACGALCQADCFSVDVLQAGDTNSPQLQQQEMRAWRALPDAPSLNHPTEASKLQAFVDGARPPTIRRAVGIKAAAISEKELGYLAPRLQPSFTASYKEVFAQNESRTFFAKYLYPSLLKRNLRYHPSTSGSFASRATYAASRIFVTRDEAGKRRLNSSYFLGVLTSVAIHTAYRPYWARSTSATFNSFGSTIGGDAGINLFHEFGPGIRQMVKGRAPKTALWTGERTRQKPRKVASAPPR